MDALLRRMFTRRRGAVATLTVLLIVTAITGARASAEGSVHLYYFYDPKCPACEAIHREVLEPLVQAHGVQVVVDERSTADVSNYELLLDLEGQFQVMAGSVPEVFIGHDALIGAEEIRAELEERVDYYLAQGGVALPTVSDSAVPILTPSPDCEECVEIHESQRTAVASKRATAEQQAAPTEEVSAGGPPIHMAYFYQLGCDFCDRKEHDLQYILDKYPQVAVRRFDVEIEAKLNQYLCLQAGVPEERHLIGPAVFVGDGYLIGMDIGGRALETLIQPYLETGAAEPWAGWEASTGTAEGTIVERFRSLGLLTVLGAGLLDGINPCAFATMIFLVSYLSVRKRQGRELLATGAAFTVGVFVAYMAMGLGFLKILTSLPALNVIGKWVYGLTLVLCLGLAWGSLVDYRKARQGRLEDMSLKLPKVLRGWSRRLIREGSRARNFVLASLVVGFAVSVVELACTGQVYLPTIIFVLGLPEWRARATLALLLYNLVFILPLIVVFLLVYYGTTSQQLMRWMNRRAATVKLGTAMLFIVLAAWLGYSIIVS